MGNYKEVELAGRRIRIHNVKWADFDALLSKKKDTTAADLMLACLEDKDREHWESLDYDPDNKELIKQREEAYTALFEMNPKIFPKQAAGQKTLTTGMSDSVGATSSGSQTDSAGQSTTSKP